MKKIISALLIIAMMFSVAAVSASAAGLHVNMNFDSLDTFSSIFMAGNFYMDDSDRLLYGYAEARALQTLYDDDPGYFLPSTYCWLTYDMSVTMCIADDDMSDRGRFVNLVYCNDNPEFNLIRDGRQYIAFGYDVESRCFRFTDGWNRVEDEAQFLPPVYIEIDTDGEEFFTMGMSIDKNHIRCFYNDQLIFDFVDSSNELLIAKEIPSPFLFWQDGNYIQISNITIADQGYLFPNTQIVTGDETTAPASETTTQKVQVTVTDDKGNAVTDDKGQVVTSESIVTEKPAPAETNKNGSVGGTATSTGDATFIVVAAMVATLGCAIVIKKATEK